MTSSDKTLNTRINLSEKLRAASIECLNEALSQTMEAQEAAKFAHWNVKGVGFLPAHELFDKIYQFYVDASDQLAERAVTLGGVAKAGPLESPDEYPEYNASPVGNVDAHMGAMADLLGGMANLYRDEVDKTDQDAATQNIFIQLAEDADKLLFFLEAGLR